MPRDAMVRPALRFSEFVLDAFTHDGMGGLPGAWSTPANPLSPYSSCAATAAEATMGEAAAAAVDASPSGRPCIPEDVAAAAAGPLGASIASQ
mmetsp:Transcript_76702/g.238889  ORF Transcript_76702/g.238889 Transcript_76702/m.238889 type:complete len:93 (-) Transcript_76702:305-583(-)